MAAAQAAQADGSLAAVDLPGLVWTQASRVGALGAEERRTFRPALALLGKLWDAASPAILAGKLASASVKRGSRRVAQSAFDLALEKSPEFESATALISGELATVAELLPGEQAAVRELAEAASRHAVAPVAAAALPTDGSQPRMDAHRSARSCSRIPDARL